ncbi:YeeE/YedE thiosulfate transporter family protein [Alkalispirochaeta alkalica]|uniref:YeeE/YedE thiosulfate transporter family protein n=1 Tax=Alkalispirochaeta alkalica TaxID=46356 RepID=UPI000371E4E8|nr:YeeE/YedE thiosulfate transporter family protein [Alkalispirochaeta alkalica]
MGEATEPVGTPSSSPGIRRSGGSRSRKKKKSQIPLGLLAGVAIIAIGLVIMRESGLLAFFWFTGIAFGFILQKARFCFTASLRDPYLTGGTSLTKAVLTAFAVTSVGFWAILYGAHLAGQPLPGQGFVAPISVSTAVGATMFGIGMVIAGGCASGTLMRVGEGFLMQILALVFFVVGSLLGAASFGWWELNFIATSPRVFLPDVFGWFGAIAVQLLIIALLWIAADKFAKAKQRAGTH